MKKIAYIIPGYGESYRQRPGYSKIEKIFRENGIEPIEVKIDWNVRGIKRFPDYVKQFLEVYKKPKGSEVYILGFSFVATIAFLTASKTKPKALILCSLSPYFKEDLRVMKQAKWIAWFRKNFRDSEYAFDEIAKEMLSRTYLLVGDQEGPECMRRARASKRKISESSLHIIKGGKHNILQKEYVKKLREVVSRAKDAQ